MIEISAVMSPCTPSGLNEGIMLPVKAGTSELDDELELLELLESLDDPPPWPG